MGKNKHKNNPSHQKSAKNAYETATQILSGDLNVSPATISKIIGDWVSAETVKKMTKVHISEAGKVGYKRTPEQLLPVVEIVRVQSARALGIQLTV